MQSSWLNKMCIFMALSTLCWYNFEVNFPLGPRLFGWTFKCCRVKLYHKIPKYCLGWKLQPNQSATVIQIVSVLHFIRSPTTLEPNPLKEVDRAVNCVWDAVVCNALSEVLVVERVGVLNRWDAVCLALWQVHGNYCNKKKTICKGQENWCNSYHCLLPSF